MIKHFTDFIWEKIKPFLSSGNNYVYVIAIMAICSLFYIVRQANDPSFINTIKNEYFWIPAVIIIFICLVFFILQVVRKVKKCSFAEAMKSIYFWIPALLLSAGCAAFFILHHTMNTQPGDRFVIVIARFITVPVSQDAEREAGVMRDRIIASLKNKEKHYGVTLELIKAEETYDPSLNDDIEKAKKLGKDKGAHLVICGKIRFDQEYYFEPYIVNLIKLKTSYPFQDNPKALITEISDKQLLNLKKQKVEETSDVTSLIFGLAKYDSDDFQKAARLFTSIANQTADSLFYLSNCYIFLKDYEKGIFYLDKSIALKPDDAEAWNNKSITFKLMGKHDDALQCEKKAEQLKQKNKIIP